MDEGHLGFDLCAARLTLNQLDPPCIREVPCDLRDGAHLHAELLSHGSEPPDATRSVACFNWRYE